MPIVCRLLSLLLLGRASLVVEPHDGAIWKREICHDEADAWEQFADAVLDFRHDRGAQDDARATYWKISFFIASLTKFTKISRMASADGPPAFFMSFLKRTAATFD